MRRPCAAAIGLILLTMGPAALAQAQPSTSADRLWVHRGRGGAGATEAGLQSSRPGAARSIAARLRAYARFSADDGLLRAALNRAPREFARGGASLVFFVPLPDGTFERVRVEESPIFSPELQAQYDSIRTFTARGIDDPSLTGRLDYTSVGFHGMLLSPRGSVFVDPIGDGEYASYWKKDAIGDPFVCETHDKDMVPPAAGVEGSSSLQSLGPILLALNPSGGQLRTYRLAISVTGEYTRFFDGNPPTAGTPNTVAQIATTVNRVTGVYEREVQIRLNLTATRIFTDPATDPFSSGDFRTENQTTLDANPGDANYDIGHIFGQGGTGGVATGSVVCVTGSKARGYTSRPNPSGDPFDIDYVAHEIGHQFSGSHTWTSNQGSCSDAGQFQSASSYEPGSGSTIMAYAGICSPDDVQANSDAYFHTRSYDQIVQYRTSGSGNSCGTASNTGNNAPTINAGPDCTI
ncbi:MAG: reprolysin-like metallopeptidase, partial [Acidobacteriota bacterium]